MSRRTFPDLRTHDNEFTIEHCTVLQDRLGRTLDVMFGPGMSDIAQEMNPETIHADLTADFPSRALTTLFENDYGKGFLVGFLLGRIFEEMQLNEGNEE